MVTEFKRVDIQFATSTGLSGWPRAGVFTQPQPGSGLAFFFNNADKTWNSVASATPNWFGNSDYYITLGEFPTIPSVYYGWVTLTPSTTTIQQARVIVQSSASSIPVIGDSFNIYNGYPVTQLLREYWWDQSHAMLTATDANAVNDTAGNTFTVTTHLGDTIVTSSDRTSD